MASEIILSDIGLRLAGRDVLSGVSLHLSEQRIGIVGRNGSGKTSLLRVMAGLVAPSSGTVEVAGADPAKDRKAMLAAVGILFQNPDHQILFPTVGEELAFGLLQQGMPKAEAAARVKALLGAEGRAHWEGAATHTLSQGQRQYLCLLAVLAMAPDWVLLDEPFAALDLPTQVRLRRRLDGLSQRVVTISHDPVAVEGADRVIWLEGGKVQADGAAGPVLAAFRNEMARQGAANADTDLSS
jgi:biotin transport system ATP-binding protein